MRELSVNEVEQVNGGLADVAIVAIIGMILIWIDNQ